MKIVNYSELRSHLKECLDSVSEACDPLTIYRPKGKSLVVIPMDEYESWTETEYLMSDPANAAHLRESIQQIERGEGVKVDLKDLWT